MLVLFGDFLLLHWDVGLNHGSELWATSKWRRSGRLGREGFA